MQIEGSLDLAPELSQIGTTGRGFKNMSDLHVMNYKQAMASVEASEWQVEVDKEHDGMVLHGVCEVVPKTSVIITSGVTVLALTSLIVGNLFF